MLYSTGAPYTGDALEELAAACDTRGSDKVAGVCLANFAKKYRDISGYVVTPEWILDRLSGLFGAEITTVALLSGWPAAERRAAMVPPDAKPGEIRHLDVNAYVDAIRVGGLSDDRWWCAFAGDPRPVNDGRWESELLPMERYFLRKDLGLPVSGLNTDKEKPIMYTYKADDRWEQTALSDYRVLYVWENCCTIEMKDGEGNVLPLRIDSSYLADMQKGLKAFVASIENKVGVDDE